MDTHSHGHGPHEIGSDGHKGEERRKSRRQCFRFNKLADTGSGGGGGGSSKLNDFKRNKTAKNR